jgi:hypothetical protein
VVVGAEDLVLLHEAINTAEASREATTCRRGTSMRASLPSVPRRARMGA